MFTNDWAVFWYHDCSINWWRVVIMKHQNLSLGMCWKLFWATLKGIDTFYSIVSSITWKKCPAAFISRVTHWSSIQTLHVKLGIIDCITLKYCSIAWAFEGSYTRSFFGVGGGDKGYSRIDVWLNHNILDVIYQTREAVFHREIQTPRRELKIRSGAE